MHAQQYLPHAMKCCAARTNKRASQHTAFVARTELRDASACTARPWLRRAVVDRLALQEGIQRHKDLVEKEPDNHEHHLNLGTQASAAEGPFPLAARSH